MLPHPTPVDFREIAGRDLGNGLKLPADTAIPIGESALAEFQRVHDMRN